VEKGRGRHGDAEIQSFSVSLMHCVSVPCSHVLCSKVLVPSRSEWVVTPNLGSHGTDAGCEARPEIEGNSPRRARRTRRMEFDELSNRVIGCAIEVHWELGPGLLECLPMSSALVGVPGSIRGVFARSSGSLGILSRAPNCRAIRNSSSCCADSSWRKLSQRY
jgi:hypothetical protein